MKLSTKTWLVGGLACIALAVFLFVPKNSPEMEPNTPVIAQERVDAETYQFTDREPLVHQQSESDDGSMSEEIPVHLLNEQDEEGMTPLLRAIDQDRPQLALELIERGADPLLRDPNGTTPLMAAIVLGESALAQAILERGGQADHYIDLIGTTLLMHASREGLSEIVSLLLDAGAQVNAQNQEGSSALMLAADMGQARVIDKLLEAGADKGLRDVHGLSASDYAQRRGLEQLARDLASP